MNIKDEMYNGVVVMKPMAPPIYRWEMDRPGFFWACGPSRKTEAEAKTDLEKFQNLVGTREKI